MMLSRESLIFDKSLQKSLFNSTSVSFASFLIFCNIKCVNAPVPGPSSTICFALEKSTCSSIAFARSGLLGTMAPVLRGWSMNCLMNLIIPRQRFLISY